MKNGPFWTYHSAFSMVNLKTKFAFSKLNYMLSEAEMLIKPCNKMFYINTKT
jgi:hypothetical protein